MFLNALDSLMVKGIVTAVISAVNKLRWVKVLFPQITLISPEFYTFRPKLNSPDGSGNPFWAAVDCLSQGFPKSIVADSRTEPNLHVTVTALQSVKILIIWIMLNK